MQSFTEIRTDGKYLVEKRDDGSLIHAVKIGPKEDTAPAPPTALPDATISISVELQPEGGGDIIPITLQLSIPAVTDAGGRRFLVHPVNAKGNGK